MKSKISRSITSLILIVILITGIALPMGIDLRPTANAEEIQNGLFTYKIRGYNAIITDYDDSICGTVTIPETLDGYTVTEIGDYAFDDSGNLFGVIIPEGVTTIGDGAFECCYLKYISIPSSTAIIGEEAFFANIYLTAIDVDEANNFYSSIDGVLFNKSGTELIAYPIGKSNTDYTIPHGVETIASEAFAISEYLNSVTIPVSITKIEAGAFDDCSALTDVYYCGTEEQWNEIFIGRSNDSLTDDTNIHFNCTSYYEETEESANIEAESEDLSGSTNFSPKTGWTIVLFVILVAVVIVIIRISTKRRKK